MVNQRFVVLISITCLVIASAVYTQEVINEESLRAAEDLQRLTENDGEKALNLDKIVGLAGDLKLQIRSLFQDMANDAADYVRTSIRDTAQDVYSSMRETTVLDVMQMMLNNMLGGPVNQDSTNIQQSNFGLSSIIGSTVPQTVVPQTGILGTNTVQKPDPTSPDKNPVINIINQSTPHMSDNGPSAANQPGFQTSNQIFVFINNGSGISDTPNAVYVMDTLKPGTEPSGTISRPIIASSAQNSILKPMPDTDNTVTLAVVNNNDLNATPYQPSVVPSTPFFDTNNNAIHVPAIPNKPIAVVSPNTVTVKPVKPIIQTIGPVGLSTNDNAIHSTNIQKPGNVIQTTPSFATNSNIQNVGVKPGNDFNNNYVYSVIGGHGKPGHHMNKPSGFNGFVKEQEVKSEDRPLTFNDILIDV